MIEDALAVASNPDYRFELTIQLGRLKVVQEIAKEDIGRIRPIQGGTAPLEWSKWKFKLAETKILLPNNTMLIVKAACLYLQRCDYHYKQ